MKPGFVGYDQKGRFLHYCHCGAWASHGVNVHLRSGQLGHWRCPAHRAELEEAKAMDKDFVPWEKVTPLHTRTKCHYCGRELSTRMPGAYQWRAGWVEMRRQGGGNALACPKPMQFWAHAQCVDDASRGRFEQQTLDLPIPPPSP